MNTKQDTWKPLSEKKLAEIRHVFNDLFPENEYEGMGERIADYWINKLKKTWKNKPESLKQKDLQYKPADPLSRIQQKTVVITYADSVKNKGEASLVTLDYFLNKYFPAIGGMHLLPACEVAEDRFNDGYFSQVVRDSIHPAFGTNEKFAEMAEKYYFMADFVLNHVDINNPKFQAYLDGDDKQGKCFYVFTEEEYKMHLERGAFDHIFRPRPFPLFTIFRRKPIGKANRVSHSEKIEAMNQHFASGKLPGPVISLLSIFNKIKNDQMLLEEDYLYITDFRNYLTKHTPVHPDHIFTFSEIQETQHAPFIFRETIIKPSDLLMEIGYSAGSAEEYARIYEELDTQIFGEEIRALTTFSHVQVDLNTSTVQGLKMLADDFSWYLSLDLDMLRLDAANFAFKKWGTTCFGLPEVTALMKILYLSIDAVSPRIVANLEVNDTLGAILSQMSDKKNPPPMMYDFHLASMLPVAFNTGNAGILSRISKKIAEFDVPKESIRFSVTESHDGKSVRGSLDLLTLAERISLADVVERNGGRIKSKGVAQRQCSVDEFREICREALIDFDHSLRCLFEPCQASDPVLHLKNEILDENNMAAALCVNLEKLTGNAVMSSLIQKVLKGKEPYELCVSTKDSLTKLRDRVLEANRFLAFYTLAFALMGRNVKSIYFNDLLGLGNDFERFKTTGELRDLKRTKSDLATMEKQLHNNESINCMIAKGINNLIALVDSDPAFHYRGNESKLILSSDDDPPPSVAVVHNTCQKDHTLVIVNVGSKHMKTKIGSKSLACFNRLEFYDHINGEKVHAAADGSLQLSLQPFQRMWLAAKRINIPPDILV